MPISQTRVVGGAYTSLVWNGQNIAFLDSFTDSGQRPMSGGGAPYQAVTPLGNHYPVEIATTTVMSEGTLTMTIRELWNNWAWQAITIISPHTGPNAYGGNNIAEILAIQAANGTAVTAMMTVHPPGGAQTPTFGTTAQGGAAATSRSKTYQGLTIVDIDDSENVSIGALTIPKHITAVYTHYTLEKPVSPPLPGF